MPGWTRRAAAPVIGALLLVTLPGGALAASAIDDGGDAHVAWLAQHGITRGCGDGTTFCGAEAVTRKQVAAFLYRLAHGRVVDAGTLQGLGPEDLRGQAGARGPAGERGAVGPAGERGAAGPPGAPGPAGLAGAPGATGPTGAQGAPGSTGPVGPQGAKGDRGDAGEKGAQGPKGDTGAAGPQGPKGDTGTTGAQGETGPQGLRGDAGAAGPNGASALDLWRARPGHENDDESAMFAALKGKDATLKTVRRESPVLDVEVGVATYTTKCADGERVVGGGHVITNTLAAPTLLGTYPDSGGTSWTVKFHLATAPQPSVIVYAVCAPGV